MKSFVYCDPDSEKFCIFIIAFQNSKCSILILTSPYILGGNFASDHYSRFLMSCGLGYRKKPCLNETCKSNCTNSGSGDSSIHSAKKKWNTSFTVMTWRCLIFKVFNIFQRYPLKEIWENEIKKTCLIWILFSHSSISKFFLQKYLFLVLF